MKLEGGQYNDIKSDLPRAHDISAVLAQIENEEAAVSNTRGRYSLGTCSSSTASETLTDVKATRHHFKARGRKCPVEGDVDVDLPPRRSRRLQPRGDISTSAAYAAMADVIVKPGRFRGVVNKKRH